MKRRILSMFMATAMAVSLLVGCASSGGGSGDNKAENVSGQTAAEGTGNSSTVADEEPYKVTMVLPGDTQTDEEKIETAITEQLQKDGLNMSFDIMMIPWGSYGQQTQLMMTGGDDLDIICVMSPDSWVKDGYLLDLTDLMNEYGQDILSVFADPETAMALKIGDTLYGIPTQKEQVYQFAIMARTDMIEKYNIDVDSIHTLADMTDVYATISAGEPNMTMLIGGKSTGASRVLGFDPLGDTYGVLMNYGQDTEVVNLYETEEYMEYAKLLRSWNLAGYTLKDAATNTQEPNEYIKAGTGFSRFSIYHPKVEAETEATWGIDVTFIPISEPLATTQDISGYCLGIAHNSKDPAKAMQFLNWAYNSAEFHNYINWGIEGEHYTVIDAEHGVIDYAEGLDNTNTPYRLDMGWALPNQLCGYLWNGASVDLWDQMKEFNQNTTYSKAYGFSYITDSVIDQRSLLGNVMAEYAPGIEAGSVDPEEAVPKLIEAMKDAGIDEVIAEKQKQLDAFLGQE